MFDLAVALVAALAGGIAAIAGFGIGSLLTPLLALHLGTKLAVALVAVPHFIGTAVRFASLWRHLDRRVFVRFGILSAAGGLTGALLQSRAAGPALTVAFGALLLLAGGSTIAGLAERVRFSGAVAWVAGALSGLFGGLAGNQGGIRSAALLGFDIRKDAFVATATAIGLVVDLARLPVYVATQGDRMVQEAVLAALATAGVVAGTIWGVRLLRHVPEKAFRPAVGTLVAALGAYMLARGLTGHA
jgi:uncharacterized membrane protein YfcA